MHYEAKNKTPTDLLKLAGFVEAPDRGWQIVIKQGKPKRPADPRDYRTLIPRTRYHALLVQGNMINVHMDSGKKKHKAYGYTQEVRDLVEKLKTLDI